VLLRVWLAVLPLVLVALGAVAAGRHLLPTLPGAAAAAGAYALVAAGLGLVGAEDWRVFRNALRRVPLG
jgi:hypothetical protein